MGLKKAVVLGRGSLPLPHERQLLDRLAQELPAGYPLWSGLTLFEPSGNAYEIDAVVLGHHGLYVLEVKNWRERIPTDGVQQALALVAQKGRFVKSALAQQLAGNPPWVESLLVLPDDIAATLSEPHRSRVVTWAELPRVILSGKLPGAVEGTERLPIDEQQRAEITRFFGDLRRQVRPGRGNLLQELHHLQRDLTVDLQSSVANREPRVAEETAALWIVASVFVRVLEERGHVEVQRLAGKGAVDAEREFFEKSPELGPLDYLRFIVDQARIVLPLLDLGLAMPSADGARALFEFFRRDSIEAPRWSFSSPGDRLWGELYAMAEDLVKRHAMLQTPDFVGQFLLDRTLKPAIETFGLVHIRVLDPACGSGNLVVGAFERLCDAGLSPMDALDRVHGVDISLIATTITRIRLLLAFIERTGATRIDALPVLSMHMETADSLLVRRGAGQLGFGDLAEATYAFDSALEFHRQPSILEATFPVVVCNPPYTVAKDPTRRELYRRLYRSASGNFSLVAPFIERAFELASADGYVGMIVSGSFAKSEFGRVLVEEVLPRFELTHVVDSSGAYIPGHGTPTMMLFGRNSRPITNTIRVVAGKKGEPIAPMVPNEGKVWSAIRKRIDHIDEPGFEDEYISVADVPRERLSRHPWILGSQAEQSLLERLQQEPQTLSTFGARVHMGSQSGFDAVFVLPPDVPRRLSFEAGVIRPFLRGNSIRDFGVHVENVALAPYRCEDDSALSATGDEEWYKYLWKYRTAIQVNAKRWPRKSGPWWTWQRWLESAEVSRRIVCPGITRYNQFAWVRGRIATAPTVCVIDLPSTCTDEDALVLLGWLNSSTACFWFHQTGATVREDFWLSGSSLASMPVPAALVSPGSIRDKVIALSKQLDALARSLEEQYAPARVLERWDGLSRDGLMDLLGEAQMRDQNSRRKMVCHQEELDWVVYEALGLTQETIVPIVSSASPDQRPFAWLTDDCPKGLQRPLVDAWQKRRRTLRADPLLAVLETPTYKRPFKDVAGRDADEDEIEDGPSRARPQPKKISIDYWERTARACEVWMLDQVERVFRDDEPRLLSAEELIAKLDESAAPGIVASVWGSRRSRVTTLAEMLDALLLEHALSALVSERYTASGLEKRAAWRALWDLQRCEDAGEVIEQMLVPDPFGPEDYRDAVSYALRGRYDVPTERFLVHRDEHTHELRYGWAGWTDEQKAAVFSGMGEI